jgi:hypothetical protein
VYATRAERRDAGRRRGAPRAQWLANLARYRTDSIALFHLRPQAISDSASVTLELYWKAVLDGARARDNTGCSGTPGDAAVVAGWSCSVRRWRGVPGTLLHLSAELEELQRWYEAQCDGDWEHEFGATIATLDNPGWTVDIDLERTPLEGRAFTPIEDAPPEARPRSVPSCARFWIGRTRRGAQREAPLDRAGPPYRCSAHAPRRPDASDAARADRRDMAARRRPAALV